jgi:alanyl-tRNA synthetase
MALFGEKYAEIVRTISIGGEDRFSYELCGGTHVAETAEIGTFLITSESSVGAGLRRIEALTGRKAYELVQKRFRLLENTAELFDSNVDQIVDKGHLVLEQLADARKQISSLRRNMASHDFDQLLEDVPLVNGIPVLVAELPGADAETLREMTDRFRERYPSSVILLAAVIDGRPLLVAAITKDLVERGLLAGDLVKDAAQPIEGSGGGRPTLAQAGGKNPAKLDQSLSKAREWVEKNLANG